MAKKVFLLSWVLAFLAIAPLARAGDIIDRIVATVNGRCILQSDWEDALRYEAFSRGVPMDRLTADDRKAALDHLIDQELLSEQLRAPDSQHASPEEVDQRVAEIRKQYPGAATEAGWLALPQQPQAAEAPAAASAPKPIRH